MSLTVYNAHQLAEKQKRWAAGFIYRESGCLAKDCGFDFSHGDDSSQNYKRYYLLQDFPVEKVNNFINLYEIDEGIRCVFVCVVWSTAAVGKDLSIISLCSSGN
jgi:hypothetical protein